MLANCDYCQKEYKTYKNWYERTQLHYCSRKCKDKAHSILMTGNQNASCAVHKKYFCIECKKEIKTNRGGRCYDCYLIWCKNPSNSSNFGKFGKLSCGFKQGQTLKTYHCIDCNQKISINSALYGKHRCKSCSKSGKNNYGWIDGKSKKSYSLKFNDKLKEQIRDRDNRQCQNDECNMTEEEHIVVYGRALDVHHIDYDKKNCSNINLITLCRQCNIRANFNRAVWKKLYTEKNSIKEMLVNNKLIKG